MFQIKLSHIFLLLGTILVIGVGIQKYFNPQGEYFIFVFLPIWLMFGLGFSILYLRDRHRKLMGIANDSSSTDTHHHKNKLLVDLFVSIILSSSLSFVIILFLTNLFYPDLILLSFYGVIFLTSFLILFRSIRQSRELKLVPLVVILIVIIFLLIWRTVTN